MTIKNILIAHTGSETFPSSLKYAAMIAAMQGAWLTGFYGNTASYFDQVLDLTEDLTRKLSDVRRNKIAAARDLFMAEAAAAGLGERSDFLMPEDVGALSPAQIARHYDFVVTGSHPNRPADEHRAVNPDILALQSGRPVLVVPKGYAAEMLADHALVAWDGKRAAARAINDAMSVLEEKPRKVTVVTVGDVLADMPESVGIARHLERHGITADYIALKDQHRDIGGAILKTADTIGAKLIVMGAYEHSKFSQDIFGGVTHDVVRKAKVPVFMSH